MNLIPADTVYVSLQYYDNRITDGVYKLKRIEGAPDTEEFYFFHDKEKNLMIKYKDIKGIFLAPEEPPVSQPTPEA